MPTLDQALSEYGDSITPNKPQKGFLGAFVAGSFQIRVTTDPSLAWVRNDHQQPTTAKHHGRVNLDTTDNDRPIELGYDENGDLAILGYDRDQGGAVYEADPGASSSGAPVNATYITQTPSAGLSNEQTLSALSTGLVKVTTGTGVLSTAAASDLPAHASRHQSGGADAIKLDDFATPDDNTDLNATTGHHGLLPKLGGGTTNFLRADGTWQDPGAGGGGTNHDLYTGNPGTYTAIANDDTPQTLFPPELLGDLTLGAGFLTVGQMIEIRIFGDYASAASGSTDFTIVAKLGSTALGSIVVSPPNGEFGYLDISILLLTKAVGTGTSGVVDASYRVVGMGDGGSFNVLGWGNNTFDNTVSLELDVTGEYTLADPSNAWETLSAFVRIIQPT